MATVKIWSGEVRRDLLPDVCMVCGEPATTTSRQTFRWCPQWVIVLILAGVLIWAIVALILTKTMTVPCPVCDQHRGHWFKRKLWGWLLVLGGLAGLVVGFVAVAAAGPNRGPGNDLAGFGLAIGAFWFLLTLIVAAVIMNSGVRPTEITDRTITLKKVSEGFVDALEDDRAKDEEEEEREHRERQARRRNRDD